MDFSKKPLLSHLEELLIRARRSLFWILAGVVIAYFVSDPVIRLLQEPILRLLPSESHLVFTTPFEKFWVYMRISLILGMIIVFPFLLFEVAGFLGPALFPREKKKIAVLGICFVIVFAAGVALGYYFVLPLLMKSVLDFGGGAEVPFLTLSSYTNTVLGVLLAAGLFLEVPVVMSFASYWGWVKPSTWLKGRKMAIVLNAVVSAVLSPPDALSMIVMMIPLHLLYEGGIIGSRVAKWIRHEKLENIEACQ